jgi:hypothetical protein
MISQSRADERTDDGAGLLVLQGGSDAAVVEQPARMDEAVEGFLRRKGLQGDHRR